VEGGREVLFGKCNVLPEMPAPRTLARPDTDNGALSEAEGVSRPMSYSQNSDNRLTPWICRVTILKAVVPNGCHFAVFNPSLCRSGSRNVSTCGSSPMWRPTCVVPNESDNIDSSGRNAVSCVDHELINIVAVHGRQCPLGQVVLVCGIVAVTPQDHGKTTVFEYRAARGAARAEAALCIAVYGDHSAKSEAWWRVLGRIVVGDSSVPHFQKTVEALSISLV